MENPLKSPFRGRALADQITNPNIEVGRYSFYSGWYHGHGFDDRARHLSRDGTEVDRLIVGCIGSGAAFIMTGNQGHRLDWVSTFPFHYWADEPAFSNAPDGFEPAGDTIVGNDVWIGTKAMISPGVIIGDGAVIGSRSLGMSRHMKLLPEILLVWFASALATTTSPSSSPALYARWLESL